MKKGVKTDGLTKKKLRTKNKGEKTWRKRIFTKARLFGSIWSGTPLFVVLLRKKGFRNGKCFLSAESILHAIQKRFPESCEAKFSIENNFQEKYDGCINHVLYLSKEDLIRDIRIKESEVLIRKFFRRTDWILSYEDTEKTRYII